MGGSGSMNYSSGKNGSQFDQNVWGVQSPHLNQMYGNAGDLFNSSRGMGTLGGAYNTAHANMQRGYNSGYNAMRHQMGGGFDDPQLKKAIMDSMQSPSATGQMYNSIVGGEGNSYIDPMVEAMKQSMGETYDRQVSPQLDMAAAAAGQGGSARHGVSDFLARNQMNQDMLRNEMNMRGQAYDTDMAMKMGIAEQADLGRGQAQDRALQMLQDKNMNAQMAMNYAPQLGSMGQQQFNNSQQYTQMPWQMLGQYANVLGAPTVLGSGNSWGSNRAMGMSGGGGMKG